MHHLAAASCFFDGFYLYSAHPRVCLLAWAFSFVCSFKGLPLDLFFSVALLLLFASRFFCSSGALLYSSARASFFLQRCSRGFFFRSARLIIFIKRRSDLAGARSSWLHRCSRCFSFSFRISFSQSTGSLGRSAIASLGLGS